MAKRMRKEEREGKPSPFWKPEADGQFIEGVFKGYEQTEKSVCIRINETLVALSTVLRSFFKPVYRSMKAGKSKLRIVYIGETEKKYSGHHAKLYRVYLNGKELEQSFEADKLDSKRVDDFFAGKLKK